MGNCHRMAQVLIKVGEYCDCLQDYAKFNLDESEQSVSESSHSKMSVLEGEIEFQVQQIGIGFEKQLNAVKQRRRKNEKAKRVRDRREADRLQFNIFEQKNQSQTNFTHQEDLKKGPSEQGSEISSQKIGGTVEIPRHLKKGSQIRREKRGAVKTIIINQAENDFNYRSRQSSHKLQNFSEDFELKKDRPFVGSIKRHRKRAPGNDKVIEILDFGEMQKVESRVQEKNGHGGKRNRDPELMSQHPQWHKNQLQGISAKTTRSQKLNANISEYKNRNRPTHEDGQGSKDEKVKKGRHRESDLSESLDISENQKGDYFLDGEDMEEFQRRELFN